jgi:iron complex outermembrane receptor protein
MWMGAVCLAALGGHAAAEEAIATAPRGFSPQGSGVEELVVVGSRASPRLATQSPSPVGVITGDELRARGFSDLTQVLQFLEPSFNMPPVASSPTAVGARPATLRGLGPDQVLVLVNGKRRHASAVINSNNGVGRGTVPVDLNSISVESIERIEVLRDGAAAQYGSDALAGVINIVLRGDTHGGEISASAGETSRGDGEEETLEGRVGFDLGGKGFLTLSGGVRNHDYTNAAAVDPRFGRVTSLLSEPRTRDYDAVANGEYDLGWATAYGFATFDSRRVAMSPLYRVPSTAPAFYPNGFLPVVVEDGYDIGGSAGLRGTVQGWSWDLSDTVGYNRADFDVDNTVNTSLGAASPRSFDGGGARYGQNLVNLTINRRFDAILAGADLALGLEQRHETYRMVSGEPGSYFGAGAQGFPGFNPPSPVDVSRDAEAAFVDAEISPVKSLTLGAAGRYEHYSDFGDNTTGKLSAIWRPTPMLAIRGTASTGFRAPSLQQQYYSTVTSQLLPTTGVLANVGNFAATDPVSLALGSSALQPEKSKSYSAGIVLTPAPRFSLTVDAFDIRIDDRIVLSENLTGAAVNAILLAHGITNAAAVRFFTNAADTDTKGWQASAHWNTPVLGDGRLDLDLGYGAYNTRLRALRTNLVLPSTPLLGPTSIGLLIGGQPRNKINFGGALTKGPWSANLDVTRFGSYHAPPLGVDQLFGSVTTIDISATRELTRRLRLQVGVTNLTNQFTDKVIGATDGRIYTEAGGVNWDGRRYFVRMTRSF